MVELERAAARVVPRDLPAVLLLPAAAPRDRRPRAPSPDRQRVRRGGRRVRAGQLRDRAALRAVSAPAHAHHERRAPGPGAAHLAGHLRGDRHALRHAHALRTALQDHHFPPAARRAPAERRRHDPAALRGAPGMTALASVLAEVAIPTDTSGRYVAAAYLVFFVLVVVYVAIMAQRLRKVERQADDILARLDARDAGRDSAAPPAAG